VRLLLLLLVLWLPCWLLTRQLRIGGLLLCWLLKLVLPLLLMWLMSCLQLLVLCRLLSIPSWLLVPQTLAMVHPCCCCSCRPAHAAPIAATICIAAATPARILLPAAACRCTWVEPCTVAHGASCCSSSRHRSRRLRRR